MEDHLSSYIDEQRQTNSTTIFAQPRRFIPLQLYLYAYPRKHIRMIYRFKLEHHLRVFLAKIFKGNHMPEVPQVVNFAYWGLVWLILAGPVCLYLVCCRCCGCCGSRKARKNVDPS